MSGIVTEHTQENVGPSVPIRVFRDVGIVDKGAGGRKGFSVELSNAPGVAGPRLGAVPPRRFRAEAVRHFDARWL